MRSTYSKYEVVVPTHNRS